MSIITLLTDFGMHDPYVGVMKGVILGINPDVRLVDLTHEIAPQDIRGGAWALASAAPYFPHDTVHLVVVDPGVGSARRAIAAHLGKLYFVGPDNGLVSFIWHYLSDAERAGAVFIELTNPRYRLPDTSMTFHGRDIFAPAAAQLSAGLPIEELGPVIGAEPGSANGIILIDMPRVERQGTALVGTIIAIDHFGNAISTISAADLRTLGGTPSVQIGQTRIPTISRTYAAVPDGQPLALTGSSGYLEVAVRNGDAARRLGISLGDSIRVES